MSYALYLLAMVWVGGALIAVQRHQEEHRGTFGWTHNVLCVVLAGMTWCPIGYWVWYL